jgi:hypothetical protein
MSYVNQRWLGGRSPISRPSRRASRGFAISKRWPRRARLKVTKKEIAQVEKERTRLDKTLLRPQGHGFAAGGAVRRRPVLRERSRSPRRTSSASR